MKWLAIFPAAVLLMLLANAAMMNLGWSFMLRMVVCLFISQAIVFGFRWAERGGKLGGRRE